jgi:hypothetical protein
MPLSPDELVVAVAATQHGLVTAAQALAAGFARHQIATRVRSGRWLTVVRGVYAIDRESWVLPRPQPVLWQAALLAHGDTCLVATSGAAALGLHGLPREPEVIEVATVGGASRHAWSGRRDDLEIAGSGVRIVSRQLPVEASEIVLVDGLKVRCAQRTVIDAALMVGRATALSLMDSALHQQLLTRGELEASVAWAEHRPGIVDVARLADGRAASQVESRVRLACIDGDVPPDDL